MNSPSPAHSEEIEEAAEFAVAGAFRGVEIVAAVLLALLVCPPLLILTVVVVVPLIATALLVSLIAIVFMTPYLLVRHLRGHRGTHATVLQERLRHAAHAIVDLLPHRIFRLHTPHR